MVASAWPPIVNAPYAPQSADPSPIVALISPPAADVDRISAQGLKLWSMCVRAARGTCRHLGLMCQSPNLTCITAEQYRPLKAASRSLDAGALKLVPHQRF